MEKSMSNFEEYDSERCKNLSSEQYVVYEWVDGRLMKKTHTRKYIPNSKNGYVDNYHSESV
tara:strand:+ start:221 stop:403 length:183 start_codon:yes stop_codon:yes gene_type:complete